MSSEDYKLWYRQQLNWKFDNHMTRFVKLRGNKNWCKRFGEDLTLPRFIGDKKNSDGLYPPHGELV